MYVYKVSQKRDREIHVEVIVTLEIFHPESQFCIFGKLSMQLLSYIKLCKNELANQVGGQFKKV